MSTALALAALGAAGVPESRPAVGEGIRYLARQSGRRGQHGLSRLDPARPESLPGRRPSPADGRTGWPDCKPPTGSFRRNLFETALASLVLGDRSTLLEASGEAAMSRKVLTRRDLIRLLGMAAVTTLPAAASRRRPRPERPSRPASGPLLQVALVPCPDYDPDRLIEAIKTGWRSTRPPDILGKRIVIKPNIADFSSERPIHTDARLVEALIRHLKELGAREIILAEGPPHNRDTEWLFRKSGFEATGPAPGRLARRPQLRRRQSGQMRQSQGDSPERDLPSQDHPLGRRRHLRPQDEDPQSWPASRSA